MIAWALANQLYALGALVGFAVGIFYGFDGWSGKTTDTELQNSPRIRNLIWVMGGGVAAFFGDVKALDPNAQKTTLLLVYFASCLLGGCLVVLGWALVVFVGHLVRKTATDYSVGDAVGDYFFYGYRFYRGRAEAAKDRLATGFDAAYREQLTYAITAAGTASGAQMAMRKQIAREILRSIIAILQKYHNDAENKKQFRSNIMLAKPCDEVSRSSMRFVGGERDRIAICLELILYDKDESQPRIILPLGDTIEEALPGAPTAYLHQDGLDVIDDTSSMVFSSRISAAVCDEMTAYFRANAFRSFASLRVIARGKTIGVVNVDARATNVFGKTTEERTKIAGYIMPFCATLGVVFATP